MKKFFGPALVALVFASSASMVSARSLRVENHSRTIVQYLYATDDGAESWGRDQLGRNKVIHPGYNRTFGVPSSWKCLIDLKAVNENGDTWKYLSFNVCKYSVWKLND